MENEKTVNNEEVLNEEVKEDKDLKDAAEEVKAEEDSKEKSKEESKTETKEKAEDNSEEKSSEEDDDENDFLVKYLPELIAIVAFIGLGIIMFIYHEPWYDEIQSWMLAKDASIKELLFNAPHYEGHPALWSLLLAVFAKTGVNMDYGLRIWNMLFTTIAAGLIIFKAPFKRIFRCLIPFTYFLFYQYTVICRPYSIMFLAFVLLAFFYKSRNEHPVRYVASLLLLCLSSAYGMLFACMFSVVWTVEILVELKNKKAFNTVFKDSRFYSLLCLLVLAVAELVSIFPASNAFAQIRETNTSAIKCLIYTFFVLPADALLSDVSLLGRLQQTPDVIKADYATGLCIFMSLFIIASAIMIAHVFKKKAILILPYTAFALYAALGYFYNHHIGIVSLFALFFIWICLDDKPETLGKIKLLDKLEEQMPGFGKKYMYFLGGIMVVVPLFWTVMACYNDYNSDSWYAKRLALFIDTYDLYDYSIASSWTYEYTGAGVEERLNDIQYNDDGTMEVSTEIRQLYKEDYHNYVNMVNFVDVLAYDPMGRNYIYNFNNGDPNKRYVDHNTPSEEEANAYLHELGEKGYPDFIMGSPEILGLMDLDVSNVSYIPVYSMRCYRINKYNAIYANEYVYARSDIFASRTDWPIFQQ